MKPYLVVIVILEILYFWCVYLQKNLFIYFLKNEELFCVSRKTNESIENVFKYKMMFRFPE